MKTSLFMHAAIAAAALCAALPSHADVNAQAQITNIKITLVDLDPDDGISPAITFTDGGFIGTWNSAYGADMDQVQTPFALGAAASGTRTIGDHSVSFAVLAGNILGAGNGPGATATHSGVGDGGAAGEEDVIFTDFTLTPNTRIEISASASVSTVGYVGPEGSSFSDWAGAGLGIFSRTLEVSLASDYINAQEYGSDQGGHAQAGDLFTAYDNASGQPLQASLNALIYVGATEVSAVPEPGVWMMFASGMAALGLLRRRKQVGR